MERQEGDSVIKVEGIRKRIRHRIVLDQIDLNVPPGRIYGLTGPNGSGKSMLLRVVCGLVRPDQGKVRVFGEAIGEEVEFPRDTGALIDTPGFLLHYTGMRNLHLLALIRNRVTREQIVNTMRLVGLDPEDPRPVRAYSTGMRQRLGLAQALMENPKLLILDEPTSALDREGVQNIHRLLKDMKDKGVTILLASHSKDEMIQLCDATFLMEDGHLFAHDLS